MPQRIKLEIDSLTEHEKAMIIAIREQFRYGEIVIVVRDGAPVRIMKAFESKEL